MQRRRSEICRKLQIFKMEKLKKVIKKLKINLTFLKGILYCKNKLYF